MRWTTKKLHILPTQGYGNKTLCISYPQTLPDTLTFTSPLWFSSSVDPFTGYWYGVVDSKVYLLVPSLYSHSLLFPMKRSLDWAMGNGNMAWLQWLDDWIESCFQKTKDTRWAIKQMRDGSWPRCMTLRGHHRWFLDIEWWRTRAVLVRYGSYIELCNNTNQIILIKPFVLVLCLLLPYNFKRAR